MKTYSDYELIYAATARCRCGAGMAYPMDQDDSVKLCAWLCSDVLKGTNRDVLIHDDLPWAFYKVREETSINNCSRTTTRPAGTVCLTVGTAKCGACGNKWESQPYDARGASHHWFPGACPQCGNDCGGNGVWSSEDKRPRIETRYKDIVLKDDAETLESKQ